MPLITLDHIPMAYGHLPLLEDASMQIEPVSIKELPVADPVSVV